MCIRDSLHSFFSPFVSNIRAQSHLIQPISTIVVKPRNDRRRSSQNRSTIEIMILDMDQAVSMSSWIQDRVQSKIDMTARFLLQLLHSLQQLGCAVSIDPNNIHLYESSFLKLEGFSSGSICSMYDSSDEGHKQGIWSSREDWKMDEKLNEDITIRGEEGLQTSVEAKWNKNLIDDVISKFERVFQKAFKDKLNSSLYQILKSESLHYGALSNQKTRRNAAAEIKASKNIQ
eukprot:TRINITY_DN8380_c0_g1_i1.p1 TRINITY_DN8380_c0_g1~~TRINITY_DN8380_c0_g1_i1.p1  ORF type:complete len:231 (-),score=22.83 TRINITY_DN8380_c0_g1_i1:1354-2046(-)